MNIAMEIAYLSSAEINGGESETENLKKILSRKIEHEKGKKYGSMTEFNYERWIYHGWGNDSNLTL